MGLSLLTNLPSLYAQNAYRQSQRQLDALSAQLASGSKLSSLDGVSLGIGAEMAAQIGSLGQAQRNAADATSLTQVADAGMGQVNNLLSRMSVLAVQSGNGTLNDTQRAAIDTAYQQLGDEVQRISQSASYNSQPLLDGSGGTLTFQVGPNNTASDAVTMQLPDTRTVSLGVQGTSVASQQGASQALGALRGAIDNLSSQRAALGSTQMVLQSAANNAADRQLGLEASYSRIADTDYAQASSDYLRAQIQRQASVALLAQANAAPAAALALLHPARLY